MLPSTIVCFLCLVVASQFSLSAADTDCAANMAASEFYSLAAKTIKGVDFPFSQLQGKVVLIVNVASKCVGQGDCGS